MAKILSALFSDTVYMLIFEMQTMKPFTMTFKGHSRSSAVGQMTLGPYSNHVSILNYRF